MQASYIGSIRFCSFLEVSLVRSTLLHLLIPADPSGKIPDFNISGNFYNSFRLSATFLLSHRSCRFRVFSRCFHPSQGWSSIQKCVWKVMIVNGKCIFSRCPKCWIFEVWVNRWTVLGLILDIVAALPRKIKE